MKLVVTNKPRTGLDLITAPPCDNPDCAFTWLCGCRSSTPNLASICRIWSELSGDPYLFAAPADHIEPA